MIKVPNIWRQFDRFQIFQCLPKDQISQWKTLSATKVETLACCCFHLSAAQWSSGTKSPEMRQGCRRDREEMEVYKYHRCQIWDSGKILGSFLRAPAPILCGAFRDKGRVQTIYGWQANAGASGGVVVPEIITTLANAMIKWLSSSPKSLILVFVFWWIKQIKYLQQLYLMIVMELAMKTTLEFCLKLCKQASLLSSCHSYRSSHWVRRPPIFVEIYQWWKGS